ncbi:uncharacterized protein EV154DRAFT_489688 [Mucor mucedo]|uniref:uncharacterized protein n=1 Tax=Mucor mucedo TaxID=29922 RepID=UPI00221ED036|nr:uncharacterized protein EV154DRAFT_489688 [Mucor mucedo]KAI7897320.1 hypothetical protein EV154DRAFT_489688 [Mucor mucedo]
MDTEEYHLIERIIQASPNKINLGHRARRELPLRRVILASRTLEMAQLEQNRVLMAEAESIRFDHQQQEQWDDWWFTCNDNNSNMNHVDLVPSALLDPNTLLDTGIIDFESSPLFTASSSNNTTITNNNTAIINNNTSSSNSNIISSSSSSSSTAIPTTSFEDIDVGDWSWLKEDKILEPISASVLLSHINYDEDESESEEDELVVVLVNKQQQDPNWVTIIPQKRSRQDEQDIHLPPRKKIST